MEIREIPLRINSKDSIRKVSDSLEFSRNTIRKILWKKIRRYSP